MLIITANTAPIGELRFNSTNYNEDLTRQKPQEGKSFETIAAIGNFYEALQDISKPVTQWK